MADRNITAFCTAADKLAANTLAEANGGGPNTFSVALSTLEGITDPALATHWAGSGYMNTTLVEELETSVEPLLQVRSNENKDFTTHLAESVPVLYRIYESL